MYFSNLLMASVWTGEPQASVPCLDYLSGQVCQREVRGDHGNGIHFDYKVYELPKFMQFFNLSILVMINRKKQMITAN